MTYIDETIFLFLFQDFSLHPPPSPCLDILIVGILINLVLLFLPLWSLALASFTITTIASAAAITTTTMIFLAKVSNLMVSTLSPYLFEALEPYINIPQWTMSTGTKMSNEKRGMSNGTSLQYVPNTYEGDAIQLIENQNPPYRTRPTYITHSFLPKCENCLNHHYRTSSQQPMDVLPPKYYQQHQR